MAVKQYPYTIPENYSFETDKIEVSGGIVRLKENLTNVYARWHLNEATGAVVLDTSGKGRNGTPVNNPISVVGKLNNCLQFNGTNQYINCGDIANFERTDAFSVEFSVETSTNGVIIGRYQSIPPFTWRGWRAGINSNGKIYFQLQHDYDPNISITVIADNKIVNDNISHHIIITYDGSSQANGTHIYIDNSNEVLTVSSNNLTDTIQNSVHCQINGYNNGSGAFIACLLDETLIYNRILTQSEVTYRYNSGNGRENWLYYSDKPTIEPVDLFDPESVSSWDSFLEMLGGGNEGLIGYNLYKVDKANKYYWNGSAWVTGGSVNNYNSQAVINTNIGSFEVSPDKIGFVAYLISDGEQQVELDESQITYTTNQAPLVNAGSNKSCKDNDIIAPFNDCSFSDPDGTIDHVYYKVDGEVDTWTEILQGGYGTLLEATQAFTYQFSNPGTKIVRLQVEDNVGTKSEDSLEVEVQKFQVTFNIRDSQGNHLAGVYFKPRAGIGYIEKDSPFIYEYDYNISGYAIIIDKSGYGIHTATVSSTDHTENFTLLALIDTSTFADDIKRLLGLNQENFRILNPVYDEESNLTSATIRIYPTADDCENNTNHISEYNIYATYSGNQLLSYKVKRE